MGETQGKVYLVGAGPGDVGLITVRGLECLKRAGVVVYDYLANERLLDACPEDCEKIYVGKKAGAHSLKQEEINQLLVDLCLRGGVVVRLKGGDPFVFGRGGEECLALREAGCAFEIVPGVTAGVAAPAYAGIPVTHRGLAAAVTFITGHEDPEKEESDLDWATVAKMPGTLVLYMGIGNLEKIAARLIENGRPASTPVALVRWGTWPRQESLTGVLSDIAAKAKAVGLKPPAITLVGEVAGLRESLNWFESRPLFGKRIVVTRSRSQASALSAQLEELGAEVIEFPVIRTAPPEDAAPLENAVLELGKYDWLVFTSVNGVDAFFGALRGQDQDSRALGNARLCAIGPATAERLEGQGLIADLVPPKYVAESVAEAFAERVELEGARILLPRADIARSFLPEALGKLGAQVDEVIAYRTVLETPEGIDEIRVDLVGGRIDVVTFTSSSTVRNFAELVGRETLEELPERMCLASIGPQTSETLRQITAHSVVESDVYTIPGLVRRLLDWFTEEVTG
ncbi:uroporphyrinogen-III C-methyltransferase [bacterium]|nr:uroporphyrinogen-III C-methyltransferase [bacterium]